MLKTDHMLNKTKTNIKRGRTQLLRISKTITGATSLVTLVSHIILAVAGRWGKFPVATGRRFGEKVTICAP